jgi:acylphosphatase
MNKTIHFFVSGRVQGVFFRMRTKQQADQQGITGWVKNLMDGRVEGIASAEQMQLQRFSAWLHEGPEYARVDRVEIEELEYQDFPDFSVR